MKVPLPVSVCVRYNINVIFIFTKLLTDVKELTRIRINFLFC